ncbi:MULTISPECIES: PAS domain-containing sensor histidine kinase [unclassified Flavobacterium]|uniref:PAS domain-containing sensor histidine kinase n=1 Tax=unclassified Flavobacterium TaxID=196869 RepID=UPI001F12BD50|nr:MULTISPECIES: PAS domain-containing sensor histidine kinase [unclassified Flavobacterium]UMY65450.1 PAS domain-containing sensor histidine kinase [Flavobacterium sp. HJ-32-4]
MENLEALKGFVTNAIDGIIFIDDRGIVSTINPSACRLFGYEPSEVIGQNVSMLMPQPDRQRHDDYLRRYHESHVPRIIGIGREVTAVRRDGTLFPVKLGVSEVVYQGVTLYVGFIHDLTQQKADEAQLKQYASDLEELVERRTESLHKSVHDLEEAKAQIIESLEREKELGRLKSRFVSMASHEFRTPLNALQLSASLIGKYAESLESPEITKHVGKIKNAVGHLTAILNDFLHLEKLESGRIQVQASSVNLPELAREIAEEMQMMAKEQQQVTTRHSGTNTTVELDANLLRNCILNLVSNAIKYSAVDGRIAIHTAISETGCTISVSDTGIGIPEEDQVHLFEPFFRAANASLIPGTGLGLSIVSHYAALMGGTISFVSRPGEGTEFTLTLPVYDNHTGN